MNLSIRSRTFRTLLLLWIGAFLIRLIYTFMIHRTPFFGPLTQTLDDSVYDQMARSIAGGNWLGDFDFGIYVRRAYPFFLGALYALFGTSYWTIHLAQAAAGSLTAVFAFLIAEEIFGDFRVSVAAGVWTALYLPFIFFEHLLLVEPLSILLNAAGLWLLLRSLKGGQREIFFSGLCFGGSALLRPNTLIAVAAAGICWMGFLLKNGRTVKKMLAAAGWMVLGILSAMAPMSARSYILYGDLAPFSASSGFNFYIGNGPEANGRFNRLPQFGTSFVEMMKTSGQTASAEAGRPLSPSEASKYWAHQTRVYIAAHPAVFLKNLGQKTFLFFNRYEVPDVLNLYFMALFVPILRWEFLFGFGLATVLAAAGLWAARKKMSAGGAIFLSFFAGYAASVIVCSFVLSRFRVPFALCPILLASFSAVHFYDQLKARNPKAILSFAVIVCAAAAVVFQKTVPNTFATDYNSLAIAYAGKGDHASAKKYFAKSLELAPNYPSPCRNMGILLEEEGRTEEAKLFFKKYRELSRI